jgi:hypothetical protein
MIETRLESVAAFIHTTIAINHPAKIPRRKASPVGDRGSVHRNGQQ